MKATEKQKLRYRYIRNLTGDAKLAQQARKWSDDRIFKELNIIIPTETPSIKPLTKSRKERLRNLQENKRKYAIRKGISEDDARLIQLKTYKEIDNEISFKKSYKLTGRLSKDDKNKRMTVWSDWAKEEMYPSSLVRQAQLINLSKNLDVFDSYGFGIMYYSFTTNRTAEYYLDIYDVDKETGRIIYKTT